MDISIILCTWNGSELLRDTLEHIAKCRVPEGLQWELVLVDNNSTEDINSIAKEFKDILPIKFVLEKRQGLSIARNTALEAASGNLLIFTDNDVRPSEEWITAYWKAFNDHPQGYYFGGSIRPRFEEGVNIPKDLLNLAPWNVCGIDYGSEGVAKKQANFIGPNWAVPADALHKVGGFNPDYGISGDSQKTGEEDELQEQLKQMGLQPWVVADSWIWHYVNKRVASYKYIAQRWHSYGYYRVQHSNPKIPSRSLGGVPLYLLREYTTKKIIVMIRFLIGRPDYRALHVMFDLQGQIQAYRDIKKKLSQNKVED